MSEELIAVISVLVTDIIIFLGFVGLAIFFHKWWIVFFSALFLVTFNNKNNKRDKEA